MEKSEVKSFLANLDVILIRKNIKKGEFYEGVGVTSGAVSQWKTGSTTPSDRTVKKIADYLGVPVSALIEQKEKPTAQGDGLISDLPQDVQDLISLCKENPQFASALINLAQQIQNRSSGQA